MLQVPAEFYPRKVFRCACLASFVNEIFNADIREYSQIIKAILYYKMVLEPVLSTQVEQKTSRVMVYALHLE